MIYRTYFLLFMCVGMMAAETNATLNFLDGETWYGLMHTGCLLFQLFLVAYLMKTKGKHED